MRRAQKGMADFLPLIDWAGFRRRNLNDELKVTYFHSFGCGDERQAIVWLLRRSSLAEDGRLRIDAEPVSASVAIPGLYDGNYRIRGWDTARGAIVEDTQARSSGGLLRFGTSPIVADRAFALTPA
jgi:mannan endo-1,4-beta-mannosidase